MPMPLSQRAHRRRTVSLIRSTQTATECSAGGSPPTPPTTVWPPAPSTSESEEERAWRHQQEKMAKKVSLAIERELDVDREASVVKKGFTKILILGQAESGKSTILKQFQLFYAPRAFQIEAEAWRAVIHLNLVRSVNFILDLQNSSGASSISRDRDRDTLSTSPPYGGRSWLRNSGHASEYRSGRTPSVRELRMRLSPLRQVEVILVKRLTVDRDHFQSQQIPSPTGGAQSPPPRPASRASETSSTGETIGTGSISISHGRASEVLVRGGSGWKELVKRGTQRRQQQPQQPPAWQKDDLDDARQILHACREDIAALWTSPEIQDLLRVEGVTLRNHSGFFLDEAERVASLDFEASFGDILKARLQTVGVEEHVVVVEDGEHPFSAEVGQTWLFYDVGGSRHQRAAWAPFFDDVNAIIFLCPMSGFNEFLLEDRTVNRLLDSFTLWKTVCASKVLANVNFILLLNKSDILRAKLEAGQSFTKWVRSYKDGPNDVASVSEYLKSKFVAIHRSSSPKQRQIHAHVTCAIDVERMAAVIVRVREIIIQVNLVQSTLI